ncbi:MAG: macro domain-containing protein [Lachnospiraceae bacterium]|nr:macro domain-containing protein [Lachnospiraceae bacterium]
MPLQIVRNDITKVKADAIVNSANPDPIFGAGVDGAIYSAAGKAKLMMERKKIGPIMPGEVAVTPAFDLQAKYILHTVGPAWHDGNHGEYEILRSCYAKSLEKARELKCKSIAFPLIATGVYGFPKDAALEIALSQIQSFLLAHPMRVLLVVFDQAALQLSKNLTDSVREYVSEHYVNEVERGYRQRNYDAYRRRTEAVFLEEMQVPKLSSKAGMDSLLSGVEKTFQEKLFEIIDARGLTGPQAYGDYVSRQVFHKLQTNMDYRPDKYTTLAMCLALHLSLEETLDMMGRAGWTLSPSSKMDVIVKACIVNGEYNRHKIDILLNDYGLPELKCIK